MAGYDGFSKSNNAVAAEEAGLMTATAAARALKVTSRAVTEVLTPAEWHHTSGWYNKTNYYNLTDLLAVIAGDRDAIDEDAWAEAESVLARLREFSEAAATTTYDACEVKWLEWSGSRNRPHCDERQADGCRVIDDGKAFLKIVLPDSREMRKKKTTRGLHISRQLPCDSTGRNEGRQNSDPTHTHTDYIVHNF